MTEKKKIVKSPKQIKKENENERVNGGKYPFISGKDVLNTIFEIVFYHFALNFTKLPFI